MVLVISGDGSIYDCAYTRKPHSNYQIRVILKGDTFINIFFSFIIFFFFVFRRRHELTYYGARSRATFFAVVLKINFRSVRVNAALI